MRVFGLFLRLWFRGLIRGDTAPETTVKWALIVLGLLAGLGVIPPVPIEVPFQIGLFQNMHPVDIRPVLVSVLFTVFASYQAGVAWTRARWMTPKVKLLHDPTCNSCRYELDGNRRRLAIGLQNIGADTIDELTADLIALNPDEPHLQSHLPLHIRNLRAPSIVSSSFAVTLHPSGDGHQHIEFILAAQSHYQIQSGTLSATRHTGSIRIEGRQIRPQVFDFVLDVDAIGLPVLSLTPRTASFRWRSA